MRKTHDRARQPGTAATPATLAAVSAGGGIGALARHALAQALPHPTGGFAWSTLAANLTGSLLIGAVAVLVAQRWPDRPLVRPFLAAGVLGGYTTFSTYVLDIQQAVAAGAVGTALVYLGLTVTGALFAAWAGGVLTRLALTRRRSPDPRP
ncbi:MAG TPA: CrcB family protein [Micromonosporaceae bacterium]